MNVIFNYLSLQPITSYIMILIIIFKRYREIFLNIFKFKGYLKKQDIK